jgi:hypothetical protein
MRIRTVKPEWLEDQVLASASDAARMLSVALILMADDHGRGRASLAEVAVQAWRYEMAREDGAHAREVLAKAREALRELSEARFVTLYTVEGQQYFAIRTWDKHQKVDHKSKPRIPEPPSEVIESSRESRETLGEVVETLAPDLRSPIPIKGPPTPTPSEGGARAARAALVRAYSEAWRAETRSDWIPSQQAPQLDTLATWLTKNHPADPESAARRLVSAIFAHDPYRKLGRKLRFVLEDGPQVVMDRASGASAEPDDFSNVPSVEERFHG